MLTGRPCRADSRFLVSFSNHISFLDSLNVTGVSQKCKANIGKSACRGRGIVDRRLGRDCAATWIELGWVGDVRIALKQRFVPGL